MQARRIKLGIRIALTLLLLWLIFRNVRLTEVVAQLRAVDPLLFLLALALSLLTTAAAAIRWAHVQGANGLSLALGPALRITMIGTFFNQCLPSSMGGDVVRMTGAQQEGIPLPDAIRGVVVDRLMAFLMLVVIVLLAWPLAWAVIPAPAAARVLGVVALTGSTALTLLMLMDRAIDWMPGSRLRLVDSVAKVAPMLRASTFGRSGWKVLGSSLVPHLLRIATVFVLAQGLHLDITLLQCFVLVPAALLIAMVPISIAGWGLREGVFVVAFSFVGVAAEGAFLLSVLFGLTGILTSLPGAVLWARG